MRRSPIVTVMCLIACLGIAACSTKPSQGTGRLAGADASPAPTITTAGTLGPGSQSPGPAPSGSTSSASPRSGGGGGSGATTTPSPAKLVVTLSVDPISPIATPECPYAVPVGATISVNKGPVDLVFAMTAGDHNPVPFAEGDLHFGGKGPQSTSVNETILQQVGYNLTLPVKLYVVSPSDVAAAAAPFTRSFTLTCGAKPSKPAPATARAACPYTTTFSSTITVPIGPQDVTYEWHVNNGKTLIVMAGGTIHFNADRMSQTVTSPDIQILTPATSTKEQVTIRITSPGGGAATGLASCSSINAE